MRQEMNTALCAKTASGILRNGPTNSTARLEGENGLRKRLSSRLFLPRPLPLVGGNVTDAAERTCSRASNVTSAPPCAVDIVGTMRALIPKGSVWSNALSGRCRKSKGGREPAGNTRRRYAGVAAFTTDRLAGTECRGRSRASLL